MCEKRMCEMCEKNACKCVKKKNHNKKLNDRFSERKSTVSFRRFIKVTLNVFLFLHL